MCVCVCVCVCVCGGGSKPGGDNDSLRLEKFKMATDLIGKFVGQWLPEADVAFLTERCIEFGIYIPGDKADNQQYLEKLSG